MTPKRRHDVVSGFFLAMLMWRQLVAYAVVFSYTATVAAAPIHMLRPSTPPPPGAGEDECVSFSIPLWPHAPHPAMTVHLPPPRALDGAADDGGGVALCAAFVVFRGGGYRTCAGSGAGAAAWAAAHAGMIGVEVRIVLSRHATIDAVHGRISPLVVHDSRRSRRAQRSDDALIRIFMLEPSWSDRVARDASTDLAS